MFQETIHNVTEEATHKLNPSFRKNQIIKGTIWFSLITIATLALVFFYNHGRNTVYAFLHIKLWCIAVCLVMLFFDLMLGSWRNHIFIRKIYPEVSQWVSFGANAANMFMGAVTPAHAGAGPAQIYVYMRNGVSFLNAFAISLINYGATLIFMPLAGLAAIFFIKQQYAGSLIPSLLRYGFSFFTIFLLAFLLCFWKPVWAGHTLQRIAAYLGRVFPSKKQSLQVWGARSFININKYQQSCNLLLKQNRGLFPLSLFITALLYLNKFCMQYVLLLGLGIQADLVQVISIQVLIQFMIYFAPSPGGSGFAELGISVLFGKFVPSSVLPVFTLLQRSFLLFFPSIVGAYTVLKYIRKHTESTAATLVTAEK